MEYLTKILKMLEDGISGPKEIFLALLLTILVLVPFYYKLNKIVTLNDFDRLLIPKHERKIQQIVVQIVDYIKFSFLYIAMSFFLSFVLNTEIIEETLGGLFSIIVIITFLIFHLLLYPKIVINEFELIQKKDWKIMNKLKDFYGKQTTEKILNANLVLSIFVFTFLLGNPISNYANFSYEHLVVLFLAPMYFLFLCRAFTKYNLYFYKYLCRVISEEEFNSALPIVMYSLDKDKILFGSSTSDSNKELYLFDRTCSKYFKFTKIEML